MNKQKIIESFHALGTSYKNTQEALSYIQLETNPVDLQIQEIKQYIEFLIDNKGINLGEIEEILEIQEEQKQKLITYLFNNGYVYLEERISLNIWQDYFSRKILNMTVKNKNTGYMLEFNYLDDEPYNKLEELKNFLNSNKAVDIEIMTKDNGKHNETSYLLSPDRIIN